MMCTLRLRSITFITEPSGQRTLVISLGHHQRLRQIHIAIRINIPALGLVANEPRVSCHTNDKRSKYPEGERQEGEEVNSEAEWAVECLEVVVEQDAKEGRVWGECDGHDH